MLIAEEDARLGDFDQALHALDAAAALRGGVLPAELAAKRAEWALRGGRRAAHLAERFERVPARASRVTMPERLASAAHNVPGQLT